MCARYGDRYTAEVIKEHCRGLHPNRMVTPLFRQTQCSALSCSAFITVNLHFWGSSVFALWVNTFTHKQRGSMTEPAHAVIWRFARHLYISCENLTLTWGKYCQITWNDLTASLWHFTRYCWNYSLCGHYVSLQTARPPSPTCSSLPTSLTFSHLSRPRKPRDTKPKMKKLKYHQYIPPDQRGGSGTGGNGMKKNVSFLLHWSKIPFCSAYHSLLLCRDSPMNLQYFYI